MSIGIEIYEILKCIFCFAFNLPPHPFKLLVARPFLEAFVAGFICASFSRNIWNFEMYFLFCY